jgi:hypothetical protein
VIVETPRPHLLAQHQRLRRVPWVGAVRHHAVERRELGRDDRPVALVARPHERTPAIDEHARRTQRQAAPDTLALDLGIVPERSEWRRRQAEIDRVAEFVAAETKAKTDGISPAASLHRLFAAPHRPRNRFRPRPQRRLKAPFTGERPDHAPLRGIGQ